MKLIDLTGKTISRWTVLRRHPENYRKSFAQWECRCKCGTERVVLANSLLMGKSVSCGCLKDEKTAERLTAHGNAKRSGKTRTYTSWKQMRQRCMNPKSKIYKYYGERGISICVRWNSFANFLADMGERPPKRSLDRIDVNGNYEPHNCKWSTASEQVKNRRKICGLMQFTTEEILEEVRRRSKQRNIKQAKELNQCA